jgi:RNA polymerase sigma-70 factor (ECF subfamily)
VIKLSGSSHKTHEAVLSLRVSPDVPSPAVAAVTGDRDDVWGTLYERHFDDVYRLVRRGGVAVAEADDVTQRVFLRVHALLEHTHEVVYPLAWLRAITLRVVSEHHRFWRLRQLKRWLVERAVAGSPRDATPDESLSASQDQQRVAAVLAQMSPKLRDVLVLCDLEEIDASEAATILGIPKNTVRSRRLLARDQFARMWSRRYGGWP